MKNGGNLNLDLTRTAVADPGQELTLQGSYAHSGHSGLAPGARFKTTLLMNVCQLYLLLGEQS